ncbi:hypothetical protein HYPSUDRAFT_208237 [Hypholoma sublateritium FD-334 SS-4]|uniref:Uncharacterized protein n=1 Tax=Hypholoma sublateritium (strain FD-334 SS-4) TaxID=945553 RepID=A0A0D2NEC3_HYPSF|nr:hypothetical protein HYPSUDRAFT_208237 [Hypholoma sublateritium FD-334 SS-4]
MATTATTFGALKICKRGVCVSVRRRHYFQQVSENRRYLKALRYWLLELGRTINVSYEMPHQHPPLRLHTPRSAPHTVLPPPFRHVGPAAVRCALVTYTGATVVAASNFCTLRTGILTMCAALLRKLSTAEWVATSCSVVARTVIIIYKFMPYNHAFSLPAFFPLPAG